MIALSAAAITWLVSGQIIRAVTILIVFCPSCAEIPLRGKDGIRSGIGTARFGATL